MHDARIRTADDLFCEAVAQHTNRACVSSAPLSLETVTIDHGTSINLFFRLNFFDATLGYGGAPTGFFVVNDPAHGDSKLGTLCCGLRQPDGNFWYPATKRMRNVVVRDDYDWAFSQTRVYGRPTISPWIERRPRKRREQ